MCMCECSTGRNFYPNDSKFGTPGRFSKNTEGLCRSHRKPYRVQHQKTKILTTLQPQVKILISRCH